MLFAKISFQAIEQIKEPTLLAIYCGLMRFAKFQAPDARRTSHVFVSDATLAEMLGLSEDTVASGIRELQTAGWVDVIIEESSKREIKIRFELG